MPCPYSLVEATPPGAAPGPPVKTGARVRRFRGCNYHDYPMHTLLSGKKGFAMGPNRLHTHTHPRSASKRLAHPRSPIPPLSALTSRATHAHPTSPRSTGFCAIWDCISSSSMGRAHHGALSATYRRAIMNHGVPTPPLPTDRHWKFTSKDDPASRREASLLNSLCAACGA